MNRTVAIIGLLVTTLTSGIVWAETVEQTCASKRANVTTLESQKAAKDAEVQSITKQIVSLQTQLRELNTSKAAKKLEAAALKVDIAKAQVKAMRSCVIVDLCTSNKKKFDALKKRLDALKTEVAALRSAVPTTTAQVTTLQKKVQGYSASSTQLNCSKLVEGETPQGTIEQCNTLFANWRAEQVTINNLRAALAKDRAAGSRLRTKGTLLSRKMAAQGKLLEKTCEGDASIKEAEVLANADVGVESVITSIDAARNELKATRKIRIPKPKVKKARPVAPVKKPKVQKKAAVAPSAPAPTTAPAATTAPAPAPAAAPAPAPAPTPTPAAPAAPPEQ